MLAKGIIFLSMIISSSSRKGTKDFMKKGNKYTKDEVLDLVKERVRQNKNIFTDKEINTIIDNIDTYTKIYLIAIIDTKM